MGIENGEVVETLVALMRHPLRSRLLYAIADRPGISAAELAARITEPVPKIRRHLRCLVEVGAVVVSSREETRGAMKTFYMSRQMPSLTHAQVEAGGENALREVTAGVLRAIVADLQEVARQNGRSRVEDDCVGRIGGFVDEQGWRELARIHEDALMEIYEAKQRSEARLAAAESEPIPFASAVLFFETEA